MASYYYLTGIIKSAADILSVANITSFSGSDSQGSFTYSSRLNSFAGSSIKLYQSEVSDYDYQTSSGLKLRSEWLEGDAPSIEVIWTLVPVDTDVLVRNSEEDEWIEAHFYQYNPDSTDSKFYYVYADGRTSYTTVGGSEVTHITAISATTLNNKYLFLHSSSTSYYVWFNVDSGGTDPGSAGQPLESLGFTGIEVALTSADNSETVAFKIATEINSEADFGAVVDSEDLSMVIVTEADEDFSYNATSGTSGMVVEIVREGGDIENYRYATLSV